jgi:hypothetical protein
MDIDKSKQQFDLNYLKFIMIKLRNRGWIFIPSNKPKNFTVITNYLWDKIKFIILEFYHLSSIT